jgi:hypothetical protein
MAVQFWIALVQSLVQSLVQCYQFHTTSFVATVNNGRAVG